MMLETAEPTEESCAEEEKRIQWADGFVLVYSICDRASFNVISQTIELIKASKDCLGPEKLPIVIVGNKRDLHHLRTVSSEEGRLLALSMDCDFYEVSAAEAYHGVLMVFHGLVDKIKESKLVTKKGTGIRGIVKNPKAYMKAIRQSVSALGSASSISALGSASSVSALGSASCGSAFSLVPPSTCYLVLLSEQVPTCFSYLPADRSLPVLPMFQPYPPAYQRASRVRLPASVSVVPVCLPVSQPCPPVSQSASLARSVP
ncbi:unnamed protein product [Ranitomeya imitator]|uniref:small monomeric GTPase n=1 Tax=Ranitomeya imitator TaxID=111125 RepID=A0ABN9M5J5_9NEOB|nr:unnamed protein product [Ranitomeya imitator]